MKEKFIYGINDEKKEYKSDNLESAECCNAIQMNVGETHFTKVKLFTHTDLDGVSCAILAYAAFGRENVDVTYCDYHDVNEKIHTFFSGVKEGEYEKVLITDISVQEGLATLIDSHPYAKKGRVCLLDHHETAKWLNQYDWAQVYFQHETGENTSGASMLLIWLAEQGMMNFDDLVKWKNGFIEKVRRYDTWDWAHIYNDREAKELNDLFWILGRERFIDNVLQQMETYHHYQFNDTARLLLDLKQEEIDRYVRACEKKLKIKPVGRYKVGVVFAEQHINEVAHEIHKKHPDLDLIAVINLNSQKISYRTERDDIDVSRFAQYFGGGGRKATAGSQLSDSQMEQILEMIFSTKVV